MKIQTQLSSRFAELRDQFFVVEQTKKIERSELATYAICDGNVLLNWKVKVKNLLAKACGPESEHYRAFADAERLGSYDTNWEAALRMKAVFLAAQEDFNGGFLVALRSLVQAEVFASELDQARELLSSGYKLAAAVVCGVVLETTLRHLCISRGLQEGKMDRMNADLSKVGTYNLLVQKRITALAGIRNNAAHGHPDTFTADDVANMIDQVERFTADMT